MSLSPVALPPRTLSTRCYSSWPSNHCPLVCDSGPRGSLSPARPQRVARLQRHRNHRSGDTHNRSNSSGNETPRAGGSSPARGDALMLNQSEDIKIMQQTCAIDKTNTDNGGAGGGGPPELRHDPILDGKVEMVPLARIRPSPKNDKLYRPVDPKDPEVQALAVSIRKFGVREPLVITQDNYLLSGHRRFTAANLAGLQEVPCRRETMLHNDPYFVSLLREYNRQRVKSIDEVLREEIVSTNREDAYRGLLQHRQQAAQVKVETGIIEGRTHRAAITKAKQPFLDAIEGIIYRLRDYWPLSDRQIHYQLLNDPPLIHASKPASTYRNNPQSYKALTELLTRARIARIIPFEAIHDTTRPITTWDVFRSTGPFIRRELDNFLKGYCRDLQAPQPCHLEILGEKNTVAGIIRPVAGDYSIPFTLGRGYSSLPPRYDMAQRFHRTGKDRLVLLVLSDFDPEGEDIAHSFARSMRDDFGISNIDFIKVALTANQVDELQLLPGPTAKEGSSRRKKFVEEHGEHVFELEAVQPQQLQAMLRQTIESILDMDLFRIEQGQEQQDAARLAGTRKTVHDMLANLKLD